jgi:uncharacterized protein YegL
MHKLINEQQANKYYATIADSIEKFKSKQDNTLASMGLPLFVDQLFRLRPLFQKIITNISMDGLQSKITPGHKLREIFKKYPPTSKIDFHVFTALQHCNDATHYEENKIEKNESDYKYVVRNISGLIREYSGIYIPSKIKNVYFENKISDIPKKILPNVKFSGKTSAPLTDREKYLGQKAATMLPILFVLDVSKSMTTDGRIDDLNKGAMWFYKAMRTDEITRDCVELGIITFGEEVKQVINFSSIDSQSDLFKNLSLKAIGNTTNLGKGMSVAMNALLKLKAEYSDVGLDYHQPWIVLITDCDGQGIDDYEISAQRTFDIVNQDRLVLFPIAVGTGNLKILKDFSPKKEPLKMKEKSFGQFFDWLKENAEFISRSRPDERVPLTNPSGWSYLN